MTPKQTTIIPGSPKERVRQYLQSVGMPYAIAEKSCGFTRGYLGMGGEMTTDKLRAFAEAFPDADIAYIVTGTETKKAETIYKRLYENAQSQIQSLNQLLSL